MSDIKRFYVSTTGGQLHGRTLLSREPNDKPPLLCLHPAPSSGLYFTTAMPLLNAQRNVIAPDYPGYGGSDPATEPASINQYAAAMLELLENYPVDGPVDILGFPYRLPGRSRDVADRAGKRAATGAVRRALFHGRPAGRIRGEDGGAY